MSKKLGIDLGSSSLGWFLREDNQIIKNGVITFETGMKLGTGGYSSPTADRREARSKRRLIQARKYRKIELLKVLVEQNYVPLNKKELEVWSKYTKGVQRKFPETETFKQWLACDFTYLVNGSKYKNPYELRIKCIDKKLSKHEFGRALFHLVQRRGYKDIGESNKETETQIKRREGNDGFQVAIDNNRTIAEALQNNFLKENKRARNEYPYRDEYENEFKTICKGQEFNISQNDKKEYNDVFVKKLRKAILWQRPLRSQKGNIGKCTLEPTKQRCPASHPIFEIFRAWSYINTIKTVIQIDQKRTRTEELPIEYKKELFNKLFIIKDATFKFDSIQKFLDKLFKEKKTYNYLNKSTKKYDSTVSGMPVCKGLIKHFGEKVTAELNQLYKYNIGTKEHNVYNNYSVYDLWHLIFETDDEHLEDFAINKLGKQNIIKVKNETENSENEIVRFKKDKFTTSYSDLSLKAMCKIIPFLQEGFLYNEAAILAKIPEKYDKWEENKELIYTLIKNANAKYSHNKSIINIANGLINKYKGLTYNIKIGYDERFADNDYTYKIDDSDLKEIEKACISNFGEKTWKNNLNKENIIKEVSIYYQQFFCDTKRRYIELPTLTTLIEEEFINNKIEIDGKKLYHHSVRKNLYLEKLPISKDTNKHILPVDFKTKKSILPIPIIDSIKNPMFNKSMSILRKLISELIVQEYVDEDGVIQPYIDKYTEIIVEVARELNDNNKRIAIERYQKERRNNREKYREFINEFKEKKNKPDLNTEDNIPVFELWTEQTFEETLDENNQIFNNKNTNEIRREKDAVKRYELWSEQKGQCMYTGKMIGISQLFSNNIEIEHTIPRSLLPDNTMANLTVCYSKYNSDIKNNRIPTECPNYKFSTVEGTAIEPKLEKWKKIRANYKKQYKDRTKPFGNEDEDKKNKRIQEKHYFKMHFDYWNDKINRFTTEEIKDSWVRRQLTDTQMVSKYALEFLKTYFKKVVVQKGSTTADFRKIYGFQDQDEIKSRNKHTHHSIDAAVLTLIPTNSSKRIEMLNTLYKSQENKQSIVHKNPDGFSNFNAHEIISYIDNNTFIINYKKDKITEQTYRNVRKRGKLQFLKNNGKYRLNEKGEKILLKTKGSTIRGKLFQETFIGKIKDVNRDVNNKPLRNADKTWQFKEGKDEFINVVRKPIAEAKIEDIIDPIIKDIVQKHLDNNANIREVKDQQGNIIRHVRVKNKVGGRKVKERINYKSKHDWKNDYYAAAGEIPYAILITNLINGRIERKMILVPLHEVAQTYKTYHEFTPELYLQKFHSDIKEYQDLKLLKVGQKVFVLKDDNEFEKRFDLNFQINRMYKIIQFSEGSIWLQYHLEARDSKDIDKQIKLEKDIIVSKIEQKYNIQEIKENILIEDNKKRKIQFEKDKFSFSNYDDPRLSRLIPIIGIEKVKDLRSNLRKISTIGSEVTNDITIPFLKINKSISWNFLIENYDFKIDFIGNLIWSKNNK